MQNPTTLQIPIHSLVMRLAIALLLGLQFCLAAGIYENFPALAWLVWVPIAILLCATFISIFFAPQVRQGALMGKNLALALLKTLVGIGIPLLILTLALLFAPLVLLIVPFEVGIIAAFALGKGNAPLSIGVAATVWVGIGTALLIVASAQANEPGNDLGSFILSLIVTGVMLGFIIVISGSLLGRWLYRWVLA